MNFAIIGCGKIAQRHAEHISKVGKLVAVCDTKPERALDLAQRYDAYAYFNLNDLLKTEPTLDLVSICTPNGLHAPHSISALNSGFHVLCEKPMALSTHDCGEMIKAAERNNKRLFVVKQNRFNPPVEAVKRLLYTGHLGKIYSVQLNCFWNRPNSYYQESDWKGSRDMDGGTLFTQFSHFIDLLYWLLGDITKVSGFSNNYAHKGIIDFEDTGVVSLKFISGAIGTINYTVNAHKKNMEGSLTIFGEYGTVKIGGEYLNELEYQNIHDYHIANLPSGNKPNNYGSYIGSMSNHDKVYENLIKVFTENAPITTNSYEGLKTVEIIEKIYDSFRNQ